MEKLNNWEKLKIVTTTISIIIIPLVIAFLGNVYSKSIKEKEIQGKFVELSIQILKEKPTNENVNIRKWAINVINEYSGVKLDNEAEKDLIEKIPLTVKDISIMDFDIPVSKANEPIKVEVIFGNAQIGAAIINVLDSKGMLIANFKSNSGVNTLPLLDFANLQYFNIEIIGSAVDVNQNTNNGNAQVLFYQGNDTIANRMLEFEFQNEGGIITFKTKGKITLKND